MGVLLSIGLTLVIMAGLLERRESKNAVFLLTRMLTATDQLDRSIGLSGRYLAIEVRRTSVPPPQDPRVRHRMMHGQYDLKQESVARSLHHLRLERFEAVTSGYFVHHVVMIDLWMVLIVLVSIGAAVIFVRSYRRRFAGNVAIFARHVRDRSVESNGGSDIPMAVSRHTVLKERSDRLLKRLLIGGGLLTVVVLGGEAAVKNNWVSFTNYVWADLRPFEDMAKVERLEGKVAHLEDGRRVLLEWRAAIPLDEMLKRAEGFVFLDKWTRQFGMWVRRSDEDMRSLPRATVTIPIFRRELNLYGLTLGGNVFEIEGVSPAKSPDQGNLP